MTENTVTSKVTENTEAVQAKPDWECVLETYDPNCFSYGASKETGGRPRRCSLHTIAAVVGRDPTIVAKEMEDSGLVVGYRCPDVQTLIFYLKRLANKPGMIDTRNAGVWKLVPEYLEKYPFPKIKGFRRFGGGSPGMEHVFLPEDMDYAMAIRTNLVKNGHTPSDIFDCADCMCGSNK